MSDYHYLAGFFDGEGCIYIHKSRGIPSALQIEVAQNVIEPLMLFHWYFGGNVKQYRSKKSTQSDCYKWYVSGQNAYEALKKIKPYLVVKKADAVVALEYYETMKSQKRLSSTEKRNIGAAHYLSAEDIEARWKYYNALSKVGRVYRDGVAQWPK